MMLGEDAVDLHIIVPSSSARWFRALAKRISVTQVGGNCRGANGDGLPALVTESDFVDYLITGIGILVAGRARRTWIAR